MGGGFFISSAISYLEHASRQTSRPGLERIRKLTALMGNPQEKLRFIHLAGTNGKSSTACFLSSILISAGYRTGLFTSPYIHTLHEQMKVNGVNISDSDLNTIVSEIRPLADSMSDSPTSFELVTAVAFEWFFRQNCSIVVLETGMGGDLDATNIITAPELSVITPIDMDHMEYLGNTIAKIAKRKAGIIKYGCPVVTARQSPEVLAVLNEAATKQNAELMQAEVGNSDSLEISMRGRYQKENASLAVTVIETLCRNSQDWQVSESAVRAGLSKAYLPGRFEVFEKPASPTIIVDGGHNAQGGKMLAENLTHYFPGRKVVFIAGMLADKDFAGIAAPILPLAEKIYTITPDNPRAMPAAELAQRILETAGQGISVKPFPNIAAALSKAKEFAGTDGVICCFGSLYIVGAVRELII